jgi:hypothetical protein
MKNLNLNLVLRATFFAGTLDIIAAFLNFYYKTGKNAGIVLKYIASAIFGKEAMNGGMGMELAGLLLHYSIALLFTLFFALIFKKIWFWFAHKLLIAIMYGVFIWLVMNLIIVPSSLAKQIPFSWSAGITNCLILIVCIGYPLTYIFHKNMTANSLKN